jgi:outer membrane receptor protein involved in Fe transport
LSGYSTVDPSGTLGHAKSGELTVQVGWNYNSRYWADFEPNTRTKPDDRSQPYRIPDYHLVNLGINYQRHFIIGNKAVGANVFFNLNNLFDEWYIERGKDGADHTLETFTGYWGQGRNCNFGVRFTL